MQQSAAAGMNRSFDALDEVKSTREQIKAAAEKATSAEAKQKLAELDKKAAELEGAAVPGFFGLPPAGKRPENFSTLNQHFGQILSIAGAANAAPTSTGRSRCQRIGRCACRAYCPLERHQERRPDRAESVARTGKSGKDRS